MHNEDADRDVVQHLFFQISNPTQFREGLAHLRFLEDSKADTPAARERDALELAVSRYIAKLESERPAG